MLSILSIAVIAIGALALILIAVILGLRRVVPTNEVHIVQTRKHTTSYGKGMDSGNTYYEWPSFLPIIGLSKIVFPVSVFDISLRGYEAYDKDRVPFNVDVVAFFRITDSNTAAQRVSDNSELQAQLTAIVQGSVRTILASHDIDSIMVERSKFGEQFTLEVSEQLKSWGVETVKNIELMDVRDASGSTVIHNIMAKRTSAIEKDSRIEVANNKRTAEMAEIEARREVDLQKQQAEQVVGEREAVKDQAVGIANEQAQQAVAEQKKETKTREMAVIEVEQVRNAEIIKSVNVVKAEENKQTAVITAEASKETAVINAQGDKQKTILIAEGQLEAKTRESTGIQLEGTARADAEKAMQLAPVAAQITLAQEIGSNEGYQTYLIRTRQVEAAQAVGIAQAAALEQADIKVISNAGSPGEGLTNVMDLFSSSGGTQVAGLLEALVQSPTGAALVKKVIGDDKPAATPIL